jgi:hypothetical protein
VLTLLFSGWFQCRLATNPDPTDERRGVSGYTFALAGEPDLDRVIRLHAPVAPRSHAPPVGVHVVEVRAGGHSVEDHPLSGARVELLDDARFESRNRILSDDRSGTGPIHPFHLRIRSDSAEITRRDLLHPGAPGCTVEEAPPEALNRRAPIHLDGFRLEGVRIRQAAGVRPALEHRRRRRAVLERDLAAENDPLAAAALRKRISELSIDDPLDHRVLMMEALQHRRLDLRGPATVHGPGKRLLEQIDPAADWPIAFWMGGWDADALCGFMKGTLRLPPPAV